MLLAASVLSLATEAKTAQYESVRHVTTTLCKATDGSAKLKFWPAPPMACAPARQEAPAPRVEAAPAPAKTVPPDPESFSTANPLRAPPVL